MSNIEENETPVNNNPIDETPLEAAETIHNEQAETTETEQTVHTEQTFGEEYFQPRSYERKKFNKLPLIIISSVLIILIAAFGVVWTFFRVDAKLLFTKPASYYQTIEKSNVLPLLSNQKTQAKKANEFDKYKSSTKVKLSVDKLPSNNPLSQQITQILDNTSLEFNIEEDVSAKNAKFDIKGTYNKTISLSLEGISNADKSAIRVPQAGDQYILVNQSLNPSSDIDTLIKDYTGKDSKALSKIFEGYYDETIGKSVTDKTLVFNTNDLYENIKCNSFSYTLDKESQAAMLKRLNDKLSNDNEILDIALAFADKSFASSALGLQANSTKKVTKEDIQKGIKEFIKISEDVSKDIKDDDNLTMKIWFDDNERIIAREISDKDMKLTLFYYVDKANIRCKITATDLEKNVDNFSLDLTGKPSQKGFEFTATVKIFDPSTKDSFDIVWKNEASDKNFGTITFTAKQSEKLMFEATLNYSVKVDFSNSIAPMVGSYSLDATDDKKNSLVKIEVSTDEMTKNAEYNTTIKVSNVGNLIDPSFKDAVVQIKLETSISKLETVNIPDVDSLTTIKQEDFDANKYLGQITKNLFPFTNGTNS